MEFRLLGLLEVAADDGRPVEIVRGHESGLLALLLLHANEALSAERIVEELWAGGAPENARKSVHIYISRLRKALGPGRIETTPAGYRLRVDAAELDVSHFETLVRGARAALERDEPDVAEAAFDEALALWRVAALADFRFEAFAQSEARRLDELHDAVVADRVDARIACGRAQLVIGELESLIERSPLWERPRGQLMRALYLTGRQADALELFRRTRALLHDELGVEPGPELQRLERQVLNHDPELGEPSPTPRARARRRGAALLAALVAVGLSATATAVALSRGGAPASSTRANVTNPHDSVSAIDPISNHVVSTTSVGRYPQRVVADRTAVWVLNAGDDTLSRIDPATRAVVHTFSVGPVLSDLESAGGSLWVASPLTNTLLRIDETDDTVAARVRLPNPLLLAADPRRIWVAGLNLAKVDLRTEKADVVFDPHIGGPRRPSADSNPGDLAVIGRFLYFSGGSRLLRVDARTGDETPSREFVPFAELGRLAAGDGTLWMTLSARNALWQVDPRLLTPTRTIQVGDRPVGVALGAGSLWVANSGDGSVSRIDPATGNVVATIHVGGAPYGIVVSHGLVWVTLV